MLRRHDDSSAPTMRKLFFGRFKTGEKPNSSEASHKTTMIMKHKERWDYGDIPFFFAAYVVDPEFFDHKQAEDEHVMNGFMETIERIGYLVEARKNACKF